MNNDAALKQYFKFDEADLHYNRNGQLTEKQKAFLANELITSSKVGLYLGLFMVLVAAAPPIYQVYVLLTQPPSSLWDTASGLACWGAWALIWGGLGVVAIRDSFDKREYVLQKVEGPINIVKVERRSSSSSSSTSTHYELRVGGRKFDVQSNLADLMMQGDTYAIYFGEDPKHKTVVSILSVERLGEPSAG